MFRLSRQDSEKRREADRIQKAQENAFKLRHVSPVRLRSASETIFGTNSGKETILDLLQSKVKGSSTCCEPICMARCLILLCFILTQFVGRLFGLL